MVQNGFYCIDLKQRSSNRIGIVLNSLLTFWIIWEGELFDIYATCFVGK